MNVVNLSRRRVCLAAAAAAAGVGLGVAAQPAEQVVKIGVKKYEFTPNEIHLRKGVPAVLEFSPAEVVMGFNCVDLKTRVDIVPGKVTRLRIVPDRTGTFSFFCDVFCGSGHEDMTGAIVVT